ncbi:MAG: hypothetical protein JSW68_11815 [Burkholderiales bacterium]|nr:MAG: hypothetical protein JSW68_11815 [Burkholderiales bacterium]
MRSLNVAERGRYFIALLPPAEAARAMHAEGRRARFSHLVLRPPARFLRGYLLKQGFRDGWPGFMVAVITSFYVFLKYARLWELELSSRRR